MWSLVETLKSANRSIISIVGKDNVNIARNMVGLDNLDAHKAVSSTAEGRAAEMKELQASNHNLRKIELGLDKAEVTLKAIPGLETYSKTVMTNLKEAKEAGQDMATIAASKASGVENDPAVTAATERNAARYEKIKEVATDVANVGRNMAGMDNIGAHDAVSSNQFERDAQMQRLQRSGERLGQFERTMDKAEEKLKDAGLDKYTENGKKLYNESKAAAQDLATEAAFNMSGQGDAPEAQAAHARNQARAYAAMDKAVEAKDATAAYASRLHAGAVETLSGGANGDRILAEAKGTELSVDLAVMKKDDAALRQLAQEQAIKGLAQIERNGGDKAEIETLKNMRDAARSGEPLTDGQRAQLAKDTKRETNRSAMRELKGVGDSLTTTIDTATTVETGLKKAQKVTKDAGVMTAAIITAPAGGIGGTFARSAFEMIEQGGDKLSMAAAGIDNGSRDQSALTKLVTGQEVTHKDITATVVSAAFDAIPAAGKLVKGALAKKAEAVVLEKVALETVESTAVKTVGKEALEKKALAGVGESATQNVMHEAAGAEAAELLKVAQTAMKDGVGAAAKKGATVVAKNGGKHVVAEVKEKVTGLAESVAEAPVARDTATKVAEAATATVKPPALALAPRGPSSLIKKIAAMLIPTTIAIQPIAIARSAETVPDAPAPTGPGASAPGAAAPEGTRPAPATEAKTPMDKILELQNAQVKVLKEYIDAKKKVDELTAKKDPPAVGTDIAAAQAALEEKKQEANKKLPELKKDIGALATKAIADTKAVPETSRTDNQKKDLAVFEKVQEINNSQPANTNEVDEYLKAAPGAPAPDAPAKTDKPALAKTNIPFLDALMEIISAITSMIGGGGLGAHRDKNDAPARAGSETTPSTPTPAIPAREPNVARTVETNGITDPDEIEFIESRAERLRAEGVSGPEAAQKATDSLKEIKAQANESEVGPDGAKALLKEGLHEERTEKLTRAVAKEVALDKTVKPEERQAKVDAKVKDIVAKTNASPEPEKALKEAVKNAETHVAAKESEPQHKQSDLQQFTQARQAGRELRTVVIEKLQAENAGKAPEDRKPITPTAVRQELAKAFKSAITAVKENGKSPLSALKEETGKIKTETRSSAMENYRKSVEAIAQADPLVPDKKAFVETAMEKYGSDLQSMSAPEIAGQARNNLTQAAGTAEKVKMAAAAEPANKEHAATLIKDLAQGEFKKAAADGKAVVSDMAKAMAAVKALNLDSLKLAGAEKMSDKSLGTLSSSAPGKGAGQNGPGV